MPHDYVDRDQITVQTTVMMGLVGSDRLISTSCSLSYRLHLSAHQPVDNSSHYQQATWQWYYNNNCAVMQVITDQSVLRGLRNQDPRVTHITIKFM